MRVAAKIRALLKYEEAPLVIVALVAMPIGIYWNAIDHFLAFAGGHEDHDVIWVLLCAGLAAAAFSWRRGSRLRQQMALRAKAEQDVAFLALHDPLTRLPNRRFLEAYFERAKREEFGPASDGVWVLAVDLDGFKQVNTLIGHAGGDAILREIARRLTEVCGPEVCIRVGGDEFMIFADGRRAPDPARLAAEIVAQLSEPITVAGVCTRVGACVGIARAPLDATDLAQAAAFADTALFAAKRTGRGAVVEFHEQMSLALKRRSADEAALRAAIASGEIRPHYQPLQCLATSRLIGFEALARWNKACGESVSPTDFIALAEELGLIVELSDHLLRLACSDAREWPKDLLLSFNISALQLDDQMLVKRMVWILDACDFAPSRLQVEITETTLASNVASARRLIAEMRAVGMRIALDDFGTGYSSLAQLAEYRFDSIKIDRSFIAAGDSDADRREIVRAIVGLGQGLNIPLTAEGIEEEAQIEWLKGLGCNVGQGYLLGRPMPAAATAELACRTAEAAPRRVVG